MLTLKTSDPNLQVLPIDSTKQHYTILTSSRQIELLTQSHLRLYFSSFHKTQHYSLSGYIFISTVLTLDEFLSHQDVDQWLDSYQYVLRSCVSHDEEMSIIGALCYGSLFIYCEELLKQIILHPSWIALNKGKTKPIIIDLVVKPFHGSSKSTDMIFVRAEQSKQQEACNVLLSIYDGSWKFYPRGEMMLFIPILLKIGR
jgi:hypothetical protein